MTRSPFNPKLYDKPIPLKDLAFEELIKLLEPRISYHVIDTTRFQDELGRHYRKEKIPGYDDDDIRQELLEGE